MSQKSADPDPQTRFLVDRMLGTLSRYLRFLGYDTVSANSYRPGNSKEDSFLLDIASAGKRYLLTRDRELARRGGENAVLIREGDVIEQIQQLIDSGLVEPSLRLTRCSLCNEPLRRAYEHEISSALYAPLDRREMTFYWCRRCRKLYWTGSHSRDIARRLTSGLKKPRDSGMRMR